MTSWSESCCHTADLTFLKALDSETASKWMIKRLNDASGERILKCKMAILRTHVLPGNLLEQRTAFCRRAKIRRATREMNSARYLRYFRSRAERLISGIFPSRQTIFGSLNAK